MAPRADPTPENYLFVLAEHDRRLTELESRTRDLNVLVERMERANNHIHDMRGEIAALSIRLTNFATQQDLRDLGDEVGTLRRAIMTAAISFAFGAILLAVSIVLATR